MGAVEGGLLSALVFCFRQSSEPSSMKIRPTEPSAISQLMPPSCVAAMSSEPGFAQYPDATPLNAKPPAVAFATAMLSALSVPFKFSAICSCEQSPYAQYHHEEFTSLAL
eukprot:4367219-Prymnesium_polylepis.1